MGHLNVDNFNESQKYPPEVWSHNGELIQTRLRTLTTRPCFPLVLKNSYD